MEKISFESLPLVTEVKTTDVNIGNATVRVLEYIPVSEKMSIVNIALQECIEDGVLNKIKLDALFSMYVALSYSNIEIDVEKDPMELYDIFEYSGIIDSVLSKIPEIEYNTLYGYLEEAVSDFDKQSISIAGAVDRILYKLPNAIKQVNEYLSNFNPDQYENLMSIVKQVGGNESAIDNMLFEDKVN